MIAKEEYAIRLQMAEMHEEFIDRMSEVNIPASETHPSAVQTHLSAQ